MVETKVRLVAGAKQKLGELQQQFIARSAALVKESVAQKLESELTQLKEDIHMARENMFGRRLFEAFASEFAVTHLNENKEISKLRDMVAEQNQKLKKAIAVVEQKNIVVESKDKEIRIIKESAERKQTMVTLLKPLNNEKAAVMSELLESVQTDKLQSAFEKYLPAVLNNGAAKQSNKATLTESIREVTGDKSAKKNAVVQQADTNVVELKRLAGLK